MLFFSKSGRFQPLLYRQLIVFAFEAVSSTANKQPKLPKLYCLNELNSANSVAEMEREPTDHDLVRVLISEEVDSHAVSVLAGELVFPPLSQGVGCHYPFTHHRQTRTLQNARKVIPAMQNMVHSVAPCLNSRTVRQAEIRQNTIVNAEIFLQMVDIRPVPDCDLYQFDKTFVFPFGTNAGNPPPCHRTFRKSLRFCGEWHFGRNVHFVHRNGVCWVR